MPACLHFVAVQSYGAQIVGVSSILPLVKKNLICIMNAIHDNDCHLFHSICIHDDDRDPVRKFSNIIEYSDSDQKECCSIESFFCFFKSCSSNCVLPINSNFLVLLLWVLKSFHIRYTTTILEASFQAEDA